jgi:Ca-activated chloride channel family protein
VVGTGLTPQISQVRAALDAPLPLGNTALIDAAYAGLLLGDSEAGRALVIVFSDGVEASSYLDADTVIDAAKRSDAVVYGVATSTGGKPPFLRDLTDASGGELFEIPKIADLDATFVKVLDQFRHRYLVSYTPRGVASGGWHRLQVDVKQRGVTVKARRGYSRG